MLSFLIIFKYRVNKKCINIKKRHLPITGKCSYKPSFLSAGRNLQGFKYIYHVI